MDSGGDGWRVPKGRHLPPLAYCHDQRTNKLYTTPHLLAGPACWVIRCTHQHRWEPTHGSGSSPLLKLLPRLQAPSPSLPAPPCVPPHPPLVQRPDAICKAMAAEAGRAKHWVNTTGTLQSGLVETKDWEAVRDNDVLSRFLFEDPCTGAQQVILIEPLVGHFRCAAQPVSWSLVMWAGWV